MATLPNCPHTGVTMPCKPFSRVIPSFIVIVNLFSSGSWAAKQDVVYGEGGPYSYEPLTLSKAQDQLRQAQQLSGRDLISVSKTAPVHRARAGTNSNGQSARFASSPPPTKTAARKATNLANQTSAIEFIRKQIQAGNGLPKSYDIPAGVSINNRVIREGVNLYDSSLAVWALLEANQRGDARSVLSIYAAGRHGDIDLQAFPNSNNQNSFTPLNANPYLLFDIARSSAKWSPDWDQYAVHAGPNAWLILAGARYLEGGHDEAILAMIKRIGEGLLLLQNNPRMSDGRDHGDSQGGVRFGPLSSSNGNAYDEINTENNLSAYSAFLALYKVTKDTKYREAASKIEKFLSQGQFYNPETRKMQTGLLGYGAEGGGSMFNVHARYDSVNKRWELEPRYASDSAGMWAISSLGVDKLNELFGPNTAQSMWASTRQNFGRVVTVGADGREQFSGIANRDQAISGIDFSREYIDSDRNAIAQHILISPEWTAGAAFAVQQMTISCGNVSGPPYRSGCSPGTLERNQADLTSMRTFLSLHAGAYAVGPGQTSSRQGNTGFAWNSAPESITSMASVYATFKTDPLAWARN